MHNSTPLIRLTNWISYPLIFLSFFFFIILLTAGYKLLLFITRRLQSITMNGQYSYRPTPSAVTCNIILHENQEITLKVPQHLHNGVQFVFHYACKKCGHEDHLSHKCNLAHMEKQMFNIRNPSSSSIDSTEEHIEGKEGQVLWLPFCWCLDVLDVFHFNYNASWPFFPGLRSTLIFLLSSYTFQTHNCHCCHYITNTFNQSLIKCFWYCLPSLLACRSLLIITSDLSNTSTTRMGVYWFTSM